MYTMNINLELSFDEDTQACNLESLQQLRRELEQSIQLMQKKYQLFTSSSGKEKPSNDFFSFAYHEAKKLENSQRYSTSRNYRTATESLRKYTSASILPFKAITPELISDFERFLKQQKCSLNTISCYMRTLRAIYNKAVNQKLTRQQFPFAQAFTGSEVTRKKAISQLLIRRLMMLDCSSNPAMQLTKDIFLFSFYTRGIPFVDIAYMQYSNIENGYLKYYRSKTHQLLSVRLEVPASKIINRYRHCSSGQYLFPLLTGSNPEQCHKEYRYQLGLYNKRLIRLSAMLGTKYNLSSYVPRHTWATLAHEYGIPLPVISEGLGHTSERTTRIYVKPFDKQRIDEANHKMLSKTLLLYNKEKNKRNEKE